MISRLTASAAIFAFLVTTGLVATADVHAQKRTSAVATTSAAVAADAMPQIELPRVEITGHRHASE